MDKSKIWVIVPAYNEKKYLEKVLTKLRRVTKNFVVVDDGSIDNTVEIAKEFTNEVLVHKLNLGKGAAMKTGADYVFKYKKADAIVFIDSDDQHDPNELELFFNEFTKGAKIVFGERGLDSRMPLIRVMGNRFASVAVLFLFGDYIPDIPSGYKGMTKDTYKKIRWRETGYGVELEIAAKVAKSKLKFNVVPVTTIYHDLDRGMTALDVIRTCLKLVNLKLSL